MCDVSHDSGYQSARDAWARSHAHWRAKDDCSRRVAEHPRLFGWLDFECISAEARSSHAAESAVFRRSQLAAGLSGELEMTRREQFDWGAHAVSALEATSWIYWFSSQYQSRRHRTSVHCVVVHCLRNRQVTRMSSAHTA